MSTRTKRIYLLINGILTRPGDRHGWTDDMELWIEAHTKYKASKYEYFADAIFRRMFQQKRVKDCIQLLDRFDGYDKVLVGHSNGCDIITRLLKQYMKPIHQIHLVAGATDADFNINGLNQALRDGRLGRVHLYCSMNDTALQGAALSQKILGWIGLGYGSIGLTGGKNIHPDVLSRVQATWEDAYDHSDWWTRETRNHTYKLITGATT